MTFFSNGLFELRSNFYIFFTISHTLLEASMRMSRVFCVLLAAWTTIALSESEAYPVAGNVNGVMSGDHCSFSGVLPHVADSSAFSLAYNGEALAPRARNADGSAELSDEELRKVCSVISGPIYLNDFQLEPPKTVSWKAQVSGTKTEGAKYVVHALGVYTTGQALYGSYVCDESGNAYFFGVSGHESMSNGTYVVQYAKALMPDVGTATLESAAPFHPKSNGLSDVLYGQNVAAWYSLVVGVCSVGKASSPESRFSFDLSLDVLYSWGALEPPMYAELILVSCMLVLKVALATWYYRETKAYDEHVLRQQKFFLYLTIASAVVSLIFMLDLIEANVSGTRRTCCPTPLSTVFIVFLRVVVDTGFNLLLLATAKGWGVVVSRLSSSDSNKVVLYLVLSLLLFILSHTMSASAELAWAIILTDIGIWIWYLRSLKHTIRTLEASTRPDGVPKLSMYRSLLKLTHVAVFEVFFVTSLIILVVLVELSSKQRFVGNLIPPTLVTDLCAFTLMAGFAWIWRPSPSTASFAYSQSRTDQYEVSELEAEGLTSSSSIGVPRTEDPVASFGLSPSPTRVTPV